MSYLVTGGAGFIGSNLVKRLLTKNKRVLVLDSFIMGNLISFNHPNLLVIKSDISNYKQFHNIMLNQNFVERFDSIYHLAANSDILKGLKNINIDFKNTFKSTFNTIKIARKFNIHNFYFASSSAIYGDLGTNIKEDTGPLMPISNYGAMKLASEALISSAYENFLKNIVIFRFPNVIGTPASHGVIYDFINKLKVDKNILNVLGNGTQKKPYLYVDDLIDAMELIIKKTDNNEENNVFNIGPEDNGITVKEIAQQVVSTINPKAKIVLGTENRGWVGDVPKFSYNINKLKKLGWNKKITSKQAVSLAVKEIYNQEKF